MRRNKASDVRTNNIVDVEAREVVRLLAETVSLLNVSIEWKQVEFSTNVVGSFPVKNPVDGVPTDIYLTWIEWDGTPGTFTWDYSKFTKDNVYYTCTAKILKARAIVGRRG